MQPHFNTGNKHAAKPDSMRAKYSGQCSVEQKERWDKYAKANGVALQRLMATATDEFIKNNPGIEK